MIKKNLHSLVIGIIISMITPVISFAAPDEVINTNVASDNSVTTETNFGYIPEDTSIYNFNNRNRFYILRGSGTENESYYVTGSKKRIGDMPSLPIKLLPDDQKKALICYIFATNKAMEFNIYKKTGNFVNISEKNPAYYFWNQGGEGSEGNALIDCYTELRDRGTSTINESRKAYSMGGNSSMLVDFLSAWKGITPDTGDDAFNDAISTQDKLYGAEMEITTPVEENIYSSEIGHMKNTIVIPANSSRDKIKELIKTYGAVTVGVYGTAYSTLNQYPAWYSSNETCNHMVTIIGWDDNYSKNKFPNGRPDSNGAWYCMNSWGKHSREGNLDENGCFWLSYESKTFNNSSNIITAYDMTVSGNDDMYDHNYIGGYAGGIVSHLEYFSNSSKVKFGISYEINGNNTDKEEIKAIGYTNTDAAQKYDVKIYKGKSPSNRTLKETLTVYPCRVGFVTIELNNPFILNKGEYVYVEMTPVYNSDGGVPFVMVGAAPSEAYLPDYNAGTYRGSYTSYTHYASSRYGTTYMNDVKDLSKQALIHVYTSDIESNTTSPNESGNENNNEENNNNNNENENNNNNENENNNNENNNNENQNENEENEENNPIITPGNNELVEPEPKKTEEESVSEEKEENKKDDSIKTVKVMSYDYTITLSMNKAVPFTKKKKEVINNLNYTVNIEGIDNDCNIKLKKVTATKPKNGISKVTFKFKGKSKEEKRAVKQFNKVFKKIPVTVQ